MTQRIRGGLMGWKRGMAANGITLTLQIADSNARVAAGDFDRVELALNDRQLRSLARDLARAAGERDLDLEAPRAWWRRWRR